MRQGGDRRSTLGAAPRKRRRRRPRAAAGAVYGAIDLGTNNCRLLVAEPSGSEFRVVASFSRIVRLGEGLAANGVLADGAVARTIDALRICSDVMRRNHVNQARCVATEACRRAGNCQAFVDRVKAETGLTLEPISAREEAELTLVGCAPLLDPRHPKALVFDIGGGSTEVLWVELRTDAPPRIIEATSMPYGVVTMAELYGGAAVSESVYADMVARIAAELHPFESTHEIRRETDRGSVFMLGTSGTVTTLGALLLGLQRYDRSRVDGITMRFDDIRRVSESLARMDLRARAAHPCIGPERADLVIMGCAILEAILQEWPVGRLRVADRGIREGLLIGMMAKDAAQKISLAPNGAAPSRALP